MKLTMDRSRLTLGDMEDYEDFTGVPLMSTFAALPTSGLTSLPLKQVRGLVWILRRIDDPTFELAATRALTMAEFGEMEIEIVGSAPVAS